MKCWEEVKERYESLVYPLHATKKQIEEAVESFVGTKKEIQIEEQRVKEEFKEKHRVDKVKYYIEQNNIVEDWKDRCHQEYFNGYPKELFDLCFSQAYDRGHSSGYNEVEILICDLSDSYVDAFNLGKNSK